MAKPFLSIVVPAFNEEGRIVAVLGRVVSYLDGQPYSWELLVVDDGSSDATASRSKQWALQHPGVRVEEIPHGGKGWAVRHGMLAATGSLRFLCDADLAMPIEGLGTFLKHMKEGYDIAIGSRQVAGARRFNEPAARHILGRTFNWTVRLLAVNGFQDTQCGFKCFQGKVADELFALQKTRGFGFDVEVLYLAQKRGLRVLEVPIDWYHQSGSKVRVGVDAALMLRDILLVRWRSLLGQYKVGTRPRGLAAGSEETEYTSKKAPVSSQLSASPDGGVVAVVIPTYNEAKNLTELAERLFALELPRLRVIVVDDNSPDGTAEVAVELGVRFAGRVDLVRRQGKLGLGTAYVAGFSRALEGEAKYILQMDADLSHAPEYIPRFLSALEHADVVVGSRYVKGGGADPTWSRKRRLMSYLANQGIRVVAGLKVKDATSGFKGFRASSLRSLDMSKFRCKGFGFQTEVAYACQHRSYRVVEHPIIFFNRNQGKSKMSLSILIEALWRLMLLRWGR